MSSSRDKQRWFHYKNRWSKEIKYNRTVIMKIDHKQPLSLINFKVKHHSKLIEKDLAANAGSYFYIKAT